ncbi:MAG TPA: adenosine deaminase [Gemmatimonadaceae bacterium]|nr:adenosine deaminase [Gemmatimonadaceae bacterium]
MITPSLESIRRLPKVELHLHLETSLRLRRLAERHGGDAEFEPHLVADPAKFSGYDRLRRLRYASRAGKIPNELYTVENIEQITYELLEEAAAHHLRYVEVRVGGRRGFSLLGAVRMLEAMARARARAEEAFGVRCGFIITIVRERGPEEAEERVLDAIACRECGVVGVDLAGDEGNYPPALYTRALGRAREAGLGITVHAGEFAGPSSIWTSLYQLGAARLGHGIRAVEDPELLAYLREHKITLEICPSSNMRLGLVNSLRAHPLKTLMSAGVPVTINSDDPVLLSTDLTRELHLVAEAFQLRLDEIAGLLQTAARAAFVSNEMRSALQHALR